MFKKLSGALVGLAMMGVAGTANASLIGDTVQCSASGVLSCVPASAVVGGGIEFDIATTFGSGVSMDLDIGASSAILTMDKSGFVGFIGTIEITDLDWIGSPGQIVGITNFVTTTGFGITASDISFTASSLFFDLRNSSWSQGQFLSFDIVATHVSEPGTMALFAFGLAGLGFMTRRRRKAGTA